MAEIAKETFRSIVEKRIKQIIKALDKDFDERMSKPGKPIGIPKWANPSLTKDL